MNFTLSLIYPPANEEGHKNISASELVCVVTADQTCSSSFFVNLLRYMDTGDDIAAAICPRICYNVDGDCDIFDQQKVAYCERMQLGMDAYGFTACMHTNMLLRARALQEIGWFPTHTLSENWELGMLLVRCPACARPCICAAVLRALRTLCVAPVKAAALRTLCAATLCVVCVWPVCT
jgi:cellulose synthase/poly-beta-1,6-N-acetylglucosamine synthase-like glycosyltransferase